ncbi:hypothetical protein FOZ63_007982 [Perkinsus olseni]|uniref:GST C-terminal domain-containing protein n=1 Tax=Perkinsus olseni TaxID=32597 RepID=A0A7J6R1W5_PEROL|nr:hypothetical protein FOZ63_007982 [Perkinsus olseni]
MSEEMKMQTRKALAEDEIPFVFSKVNEIIGDKKFATGDKMTIADLALTNMMEALTSGYIDGFPTTLCDAYFNLKRIQSNVHADPRVTAWKEKREVSASSQIPTS